LPQVPANSVGYTTHFPQLVNEGACSIVVKPAGGGMRI